MTQKLREGISLRLRGLYLTIFTLGLLAPIAHTLDAYPVLSGAGGQKDVPMYVALGDSPEAKLPTSLQTAVLLSVLVIAVLIVKPLGLFGRWLQIKRYFRRLAVPLRKPCVRRSGDAKAPLESIGVQQTPIDSGPAARCSRAAGSYNYLELFE